MLFASWGSLLIVALLELARERRPLARSPLRRWASNLTLGWLNRWTVGWLVPVGAFAAAHWAEAGGVGLLNLFELPTSLVALSTIVLLDLAAWAEHRLSHALPWLWRLHRVHHADPDLDFSTTHRHHPVAAAFTGGVRAGAAVCIGATPVGVLLYYLLRGPVDAFAHGNIRLPAGFERALRGIVVTPDFHAVHHSAARRETDANFSALFSWWDLWFGTGCAEPKGGVAGMALGLEGFRESRDLDLDRLLWQPFRSEGVSGDEKACAQAGE